MIRIVLVFFAASLVILTAGTGFAGGTLQEEASKKGVVEFCAKVLRIVA